MTYGRLFGITALCCYCELAIPYEATTHRVLTEAAAVSSVLSDAGNDPARPPKLVTLGFLRPLNDIRQRFVNSKGSLGTLLAILQDGAEFEDDALRSMHHFFDPRTDRGLHFDPASYPNDSVLQIAIADINASTLPSLEWSLGTSLMATANNNYTYNKARDYWFQSVTNLSSAMRDNNTALAFESLGHIVHHIQDMAQPQHVRNDPHLQDSQVDKQCAPPTNSFYAALCPAYQTLRNESFYEKWTKDLGTHIPTGGYGAVYGPMSDGLAVFTTPSSYWMSQGKGLAEYTNRNFVSAGTTSVSPPLLGAWYEVTLRDVCTGAYLPCPNIDLNLPVVFFPSVVDDQFRASSIAHPYAAAASLFSPDFQTYYGTFYPLVVNRATITVDHQYLLPRAVGYSAGLINYFFRGDMEIGLPDENVYAVVDQGSNSCGNPCGFRKLKLKLKNITAGNEAMGAGTLRAVVKYHSNSCYRSDLAGEYGGDPTVFKGNACRSPEEYVAVSQPVPITDGEVRSDQGKLFTFLFDDQNPVPIRTSDAYLQVVFRGKLGQEDDAVAVTTKIIVEPNYVAVANMTDYAYDDTGDNKYHAIPYKTVFGDLSVGNFGIAFGSNTTPVATMVGLSGGQHAQIAFLTDVAELPATISFSGYHDQSWVLEPEEFALDDTTGQFVRSCPVFLARGVYRQYLYWFYNPVSPHGLGFRQISSQRGEMPAAGAGGDKLRKQSSINYDCKIPTGGVYDFSTMTPLSPNTALPWTINF